MMAGTADALDVSLARIGGLSEANRLQPGQPYSAAAAGFGRLGSTVGRTVGLGTPRQVQFAIRLSFWFFPRNDRDGRGLRDPARALSEGGCTATTGVTTM